MADRIRIVVMGAAGRDFHNFNLVYRQDPSVEVVAFTASQIPGIAGRTYPAELAGPLYPSGIPIVPEARLRELIDRHRVDEVVFAYSDVSHAEVMHAASKALASGADFRLLGPHRTQLQSRRPVVSVCAVRTGCGKTPTARRVVAILRDRGRRPVVIRHPMPYGDLARQAVQRFGSLEDLAAARCTIEEIEEYEPHLRDGTVVFAGVDYAAILARAEEEADAIVWDGGNNDLPFIRPDLAIVLVDPHRPGDETAFHPGEANLLSADVLVLAKTDTARAEDLERVRHSVRAANPAARVVESAMPVTVDRPELIRGRRVLVIEDGPTVTHGGMARGAGMLAARRGGAREIVDPRPFAVGSLVEVFGRHPHLDRVLPAMGYAPSQMLDLERTIARADCEAVLIATPADLRRLMRIDRPVARATYEYADAGSPTLDEILAEVR